MTDDQTSHSGGCLCGQLRWTAASQPQYQGLCFCGDCRKATGSAFVGFMSYPAEALAFSGESLRYASPALRGGQAVRNSCPVCGSLVFGGIVGEDVSHTIYSGSLDDPARFRPAIAIFARDRPDWIPMPEGLQAFETLPPSRPG